MTVDSDTRLKVNRLLTLLQVKSETAVNSISMLRKPVHKLQVTCVCAGIILHWLRQTGKPDLKAAFEDTYESQLKNEVGDTEAKICRDIISDVLYECSTIVSGCSHAGRDHLDLINIGYVFALADVFLKHVQSPATEESRGHAASMITSLLEGVNQIS